MKVYFLFYTFDILLIEIYGPIIRSLSLLDAVKLSTIKALFHDHHIFTISSEKIDRENKLETRHIFQLINIFDMWID